MIKATLRYLLSFILIIAGSFPIWNLFMSMINERSDVLVLLGFLGILLTAILQFKIVEYITFSYLNTMKQFDTTPTTTTKE